MNWFTIVIVIGLSQSLLLISVVLKKYRGEHRFLLSLLTLISIGLALRLGYSSSLYVKWVKWLPLSDVAMLLFGPLFYGFISSSSKVKPREHYWIHLLPTLLFLVHYVFRILPYSALELISKEQQGVFDSFYTLFFIIGILSNIYYLSLSFRYWKKTDRNKTRSFSPLKAVLLFNCITVFSWLVTFLIALINPEKYWVLYYGYQITFILLSLGVITFSYWTLLGSAVLSSIETQKKYAQSNFSEKELINWSKSIKDIMVKDQLFLQASLSLEDLAKRAGLNKTQLSQTINRQFNKGFTDWINEYRLDEFIQRVDSNKFRHLTFIGIATEVGFNTKATFNKAFKKYKGKTPTQYFEERSHIVRDASSNELK